MFKPEKDHKALGRPPTKPDFVDEEPRPTVKRPVYRPQLFGGWGPKL